MHLKTGLEQRTVFAVGKRDLKHGTVETRHFEVSVHQFSTSVEIGSKNTGKDTIK